MYLEYSNIFYNALFILASFIFYIKLFKIKPSFFDYALIFISGTSLYLNPIKSLNSIISLLLLIIFIKFRLKTSLNSIAATTPITLGTILTIDFLINTFNEVLKLAPAFVIMTYLTLIPTTLIALYLYNKMLDFKSITSTFKNSLIITSFLPLSMILMISTNTNTNTRLTHLTPVIVYYLIIIILMLVRSRLYIINTQWKNTMDEMASVKDLNLKIRSQKHDFNNHLQVISALIQAAKYDNCYDYIINLNKHGFSVDNINTGIESIQALIASKRNIAQNDGIIFEDNIFDNIGGDFNMQSWEITSILGNLIDNAIHEERKSKKEKKIIRFTLRKSNDYFEFMVNSNGSYIEKDLIGRIFEPGFSTKGCANRGMGLHIIKDIVERHDGHMEVNSIPEDGTTFLLYLPQFIPEAKFDDTVK